MTSEALRGIARYPLRSTLALLGLVVGVGSVVATLALLDAAHRQGMAVLEKAGALDVVRLASPAGTFRDGRWMLIQKRARLGPADVARIRGAIPWVADAMLASEASFPLRSAGAAVSVVVRGVSSQAPRFLGLKLQGGRFLSSGEESAGEKVAVLSNGLGKDLYPSAAGALGREVLIEGQRFTVVGILVPVEDERGNEEASCYIPFRAATERLGTSPVDVRIHLAAGRREGVAPLEAAVKALLPSLQPGVEAASYEVDSSRQAIEDLEAVERTQATILGGIAALSLLVAASGVLTTLLVSVKERTREIGTRRALGARRRTILAQFLLEAAFLVLPGVSIGLGAGVLLTRALGPLFERSLGQPILADLHVGSAEALAATALAILLALGAGLWPAWQATRVEPAEALRYE
jgi:ABC-type antimicrobial peptide transport system permease subunit